MRNNTYTESNKMIILSIIMLVHKNMIYTNVIIFIKFIVIINYNITCIIIVCILDLHIYIVEFSHDNHIYIYLYVDDRIKSMNQYLHIKLKNICEYSAYGIKQVGKQYTDFQTLRYCFEIL